MRERTNLARRSTWDVPGFFNALFGEVANLSLVVDTVFSKCYGGEDPLYSEDGWRDWPKEQRKNRF